jgi:hypothetical protein
MSAFGEIIDLDKAELIAKRDATFKRVASDASAYAWQNRWQYYFGINLWYHVVYDIMYTRDPAGHAARHLVDHIDTYGLLATIELTCEAAQAIVSEQPVPINARFLVTDDIVDTLQMLRFLKRFTALGPDLLYAKAQTDWLATEKKIASFNTRAWVENSRYAILMDRVKSILAEWTAGYKPVAIDDELPVIPTGATFEKVGPSRRSLNLSERINKYVRRAHNGRRWVFDSAGDQWEQLKFREEDEIRVEKSTAFGRIDQTVSITQPFVISTSKTPQGETRIDSWRKFSLEEIEVGADGVAVKHEPYRAFARTGSYRSSLVVRRYRYKSLQRFNTLVFVPKNYKTPRSVCPEEVLNQMMQRKIRDHLEACLPKWVKAHLPIRDQRVMEAVAACGFSLHVTTTDLHAASDSFSIRVFCDAFSGSLRDDVMRWRPTHTILSDGSSHTLQQLSTMGTGNVWLLMALFLLALMVAVCELCCLADDRKNACFAFGDDLEHPDEITDTLYWALGVCGFVVNEDKSYGGSSRYRESCGSEWWLCDDGSVLSLRTLYYPRFPIANGGGHSLEHDDYDPLSGNKTLVDGLSRMIELQHALYNRGLVESAEFLTRAIKRVEPRMTTSLIGTVCSDLWGPYAEGKVVQEKRIIGSDISEEVTCSWGDYHVTFKPPKAERPIPVYYDEELGAEVPANTRIGHLRPETEAAGLPSDDATAEWFYYLFLRNGPVRSSDSLDPCVWITERQKIVDFTNVDILWGFAF